MGVNMSFVKALATLAVGFAAARGVDKFRKMGGVDGMKDALRSAGAPGGMADQMGDMAEKFGVPGGKDAVRDMFTKFGTQAAAATEATEAGLGGLMNAMTGAAATGAKGLSDMIGAVTAGTPANAILEEQAKLMIRAMIQAAKADGEIDADERTKIMDHLGDASDEEIAFVQAELDAPVDVAALAAAAGESTKAQVYSAALMAITVDTEAEKQYLANLAAALGLEAAKVLEIHHAMGKPTV
jgi:uncharacterized membrane protein YebE (DUF533 family)